MANRIGLFVDIQDMYENVSRKFRKKKLDYKKFLEYVNDLGKVVIAKAYGRQLTNEAVGFLNCLKKFGYLVSYRKVTAHSNDRWDVGITVDIFSELENIDTVVIGASHRNFLPLINKLLILEKRVLVIGAQIDPAVKTVTQSYVEVTLSMLEEKDDIANK